MDKIPSVEAFKEEQQIAKPKTRNFYKELSRNLNDDLRPLIEKGREKEYEGYSKEVKENLYNLETRFHFLDIMKKRNRLRQFLFHRRQYSRQFKLLNLPHLAMMVKEVNHTAKRQDSEATLVGSQGGSLEDYSAEQNKEKRVFSDEELVSSPENTVSLKETLEAIQETSASSSKQEKNFQVHFNTNVETIDNIAFSHNNKDVSHDESTKRYHVYGTLADKGVRNVTLTKEQRKALEFVMDKKIQRALKENTSYLLELLDMRRTYKRTKKDLQDSVLRDKSDESAREGYLEQCEQKWNEILREVNHQVNEKEGPVYDLAQEIKECKQEIKGYSAKRKILIGTQKELLEEKIELVGQNDNDKQKLLEKNKSKLEAIKQFQDQNDRWEENSINAYTRAQKEFSNELNLRCEIIKGQAQQLSAVEKQRFLKHLYTYTEAKTDRMINEIGSFRNLMTRVGEKGADALIHISMYLGANAFRTIYSGG